MTANALADALAHHFDRQHLHWQEPLARYTTWKVGGPADVLVIAQHARDLVIALAIARVHRVPWLVMGRGSNILISDQGVAGLVVLNYSRDVRIERHAVIADSGAMLTALAKRTCAAGLSGLEWAAGIPGSVGGAIVNNAGAHGSDVGAVLQSADVAQPDGQIMTYTPAMLKLGYRQSIFRTATDRVGVLQADFSPVIVSGTFALAVVDAAVALATLEEHRAYRRRTQPQGQPSAGSVFKNPPTTSAGRCIDDAGLKEAMLGGAQVSDVHANFIVNTGTATANDVAALIGHIRATVHARTGTLLMPEVQPVGRWTTSDPLHPRIATDIRLSARQECA